MLKVFAAKRGWRAWCIGRKGAHCRCHVGICVCDESAVAATVEALCKKGRTATGRAVDVSDGEALKAWIKAVGHELGGLDILVPNVSGMGGPAGGASWRRNFEMDVLGTVHAVEAAMPFLEAFQAAAIVVDGDPLSPRTFGTARGSCEGGCVFGEPGCELYHWNQSDRRRGLTRRVQF